MGTRDPSGKQNAGGEGGRGKWNGVAFGGLLSYPGRVAIPQFA